MTFNVIGDFFFMNDEYTITEDILFTNFIRSKPNILKKQKHFTNLH